MAGGRTLTVHLAADTNKFRRDMQAAGAAAGGLGSRVGGLASSMTAMLGPALLGAGIAAGALAVKLGVDGVQAAIEDEKAAAKLAQTLDNLGLAHDTGKVEAYIDAMQRSTGVADDQLRPAYARLVTSLGDTQRANDALALALDISVGTGKSLETVVAALGKAYDGNTGSLGRLGVGLDKAIIKSGDMDVITQALSERFQGQAATAADTWGGKIDRVSVAFDELKEAFGKGFLSALTEADSAMGPDGMTKTMQDLEPAIQNIGKALGETVIAIGDIIGWVGQAMTAFDTWRQGLDGWQRYLVDTVLASVKALTLGVIALRDAIQGAINLWNQLTSISGSGVPSPDIGVRGIGQPSASPTSSSRTPSVVAPVVGLSSAISAQNRRTTGRPVLLT